MKKQQNKTKSYSLLSSTAIKKAKVKAILQ